MDWDTYFMRMAALVATKSKDRSTKVGVVLVAPDRSVIGTGYNGFPRGVDDNVEERHQRPKKYAFTSHAEMNVITNCARNGVKTMGSTIYIASYPDVIPTCSDCARAMIQAGIKEIVCKLADVPERWKDSCDAASEMLKEAGVTVRYWQEGSK